MKKMLKLTLFKKTFLIIFCGLLLVEGVQLYVDYEDEKSQVIWNKINHNNIPDTLSMIEMEYEGKSISLDKAKEIINDKLGYLGSYYSIIDHNNNILYEDAKIPYFTSKPRITNLEWYPIDLSEISEDDIAIIEDYILKNKDILLEIEYQGDKEDNKDINPSYLSINNDVIIGELSDDKDTYKSAIHIYTSNHVYYRDYTNGENTKPQAFTRDEYLNPIREASNELYDEFGGIGYTRIGYKVEGKDLFISEKVNLNIEGERCFLNYALYSPNALDNLLFQTMYPKYHVYNMMVFMVFVMSLLISYMVTYRIKRLNEASMLIEHKFFNIKIDDKSKDEIGDLARKMNEMSDRLGSTIEQLNTEIQKVKELESLRKDFINQFTHEMKTPLGIINGYSELLEETENEEERQRYLDIINKETVRINDLVQGMLRLSRLEAGKVELNKEVLDLEDIVTEVIDEFEVLLMKKNIKIDVNIIDKHLTGDKQQIITVLRNFISNAIKHTDSKIVVTVDKGVRVYNEGLPIDKDKLEDIWYTFVTHDKTGTGLGLAICRSILELHNYSYGVVNKDNGVEFYFNG